MPTATNRRDRLGDLLVKRNVITQDQLSHALDVQRRGRQEKLVGEILVDLGYASAEQVLAAVAEGCGVPFARLVPPLVDPKARSALPETFIQKHGVLPLFRVRDVLTVAAAEPANLFLADEIAQTSGLVVQVVAASGDNIYEMVEQTRAAAGADAEGADPDLRVLDHEIQPEDYESAYESWPAEEVAGLLVREAVRARAAAIHLEPEEKVLRVRFRIDGALHVVMRPPMRLAAGLLDAFRAMLDLAGDEASGRAPSGGGRIALQGAAAHLHLDTLGGAFGTRAVVRLVRDDESQRPLEKLGCDFDLLADYMDRVARLRGLFLVAGPGDCGATTTLYSTLHYLDPVRSNICTYEARIGYRISGINQFSPATTGHGDADAAFDRLCAQQPDVVMLDDMLDEALAPSVLRAAREGCFVLARMRAVDAADAAARLAAWTGPAEVTEVLRGVLGQRLVRIVCPHCKTTHEPPGALRRSIAETFGRVEAYVKGRGCAACRRTGFLGRIGCFELLPGDGAVAEALRAGGGAEALRKAARGDAPHPLWADGIHKVRAGITSLAEAADVLATCPGFDLPTP